MPRNRQLVLMNPSESPEGVVTGELRPLGSLAEVQSGLARFNTASDGSERPGSTMVVLHGPGIVVELPKGVDPVMQLMVTLKDDDLAFVVLWRLCRRFGWKMMDAETGQTFG